MLVWERVTVVVLSCLRPEIGSHSEPTPIGAGDSSRRQRPDSAGGELIRAKGILNSLRVLGNDHEQDARRPCRLPMTLLPVLNRIQRKTKLRSKLSLTQPHPGTQFSHVHLRRWNVGDSHTDSQAPRLSRAIVVWRDRTPPAEEPAGGADARRIARWRRRYSSRYTRQ